MKREQIESTNIHAIGYDAESGTLTVEFKAGKSGVRAVWEYFPVPTAVFEAMRDPQQSAGRTFHAAVKNNPLVTARLIEHIIEESGLPVGMPS